MRQPENVGGKKINFAFPWKIFCALNGLFCADVPLRNYSLILCTQMLVTALSSQSSLRARSSDRTTNNNAHLGFYK